MIFVWILFWLGCAIWVLAALLNYRTTRIIRQISEYNSPEPKTWPRVSIIIAACNEADTIEEAVKSKLDSDYPDFEVILIDDRSTDGTGEIVDRLAESDSRIKPVHITELPDGWLGKQHALKKGVEAASGDWFLFTDADVHFSKDVISKTVAICEDKKLDQLGGLPNLWSGSFILNVVIAAFVRLYTLTAKFWGLDLQWVETFTGVGAYSLVRRSAFEKTEGFDWLNVELADDVCLGLMIRRSGGKTWLVGAAACLKVKWYTSIQDMMVGLERVSFATAGNFSFRTTLFRVAQLLVIELFPFVVLATVHVAWVQWVCIGLIMLGLMNAIWIVRWGNGNVAAAFLYPVGALIFSLIILRGGWLGRRRGGVWWRGTFYPTEVLRKGKRVRMM